MDTQGRTGRQHNVRIGTWGNSRPGCTPAPPRLASRKRLL